MTREEIIRMAREAGLADSNGVVHAAYQLERFASLVAAAEAEKHKWDIHSCGPTCERYVCAARRKAVEAEREAIIDIIEEYRISLPVLGELKADIRARGERNE